MRPARTGSGAPAGPARASGDDRRDLLLLVARWCYERRPVVLSSGKASDYYLDCRRVTLDPEGAQLCGRVLYSMYAALGERVAAVGGPTLGADPLVVAFLLTALGHGERIPGFLVRKAAKEHGTRSRIEGAAGVPAGARVLLLEDVLTTGRSLVQAAEAVREAGFDPVHALVLVDREEGGREALSEAGLPVRAVFCASEVVRAADGRGEGPT